MKVIYRPSRIAGGGKRKKPQPPKRTAFVRVGTVVECDGVLWRLDRVSDIEGPFKLWRRVVRIA